MARRLVRGVLSLAAILFVAAVGGGLYIRQQLHASLPVLDGTLALAGLSAPVSIERDSLGVPTITAATRADAARALGFLHAQDRFFQMDLQRRQAAGELSELVGSRALEVDRGSRVHRFRHISQEAVRRAAPAYRALLDAYAAGVNAGLAALGAPPPEYLVLRQSPEPWAPEDSILTIVAMFNTLQGRQAQFEATFGTLADTLPPAMYAFLTARGSEWDAPIVGDRFPRPPVPADSATETQRHREIWRSDDLVSSRSKDPAVFRSPDRQIARSSDVPCVISWLPCLTEEEAAGLGSNNWAVAGTHTAGGGALVANDMHLAINVPNIWYRAQIVVRDTPRAGETLTLNGVTLPGLVTMVVGSNGHVAWGFTNTGGDWSDLIIVEPDAHLTDHYLTPDGPKPVTIFDDPIATTDGSTPFQSRWTIWGPIVRRDHRGRELVQRWVAHDPVLLAKDVTAPETARTLDEALDVAAGLGIPAQNFVAADSSGRIGWTIAGPIPRRVGFDGSRPTSWADGSRRWDGYLSREEFPRVADPASGRVWTANAPVVDGDMLARIGEGGYADGIRARVIRDRLLAIEQATPAEMLAIQLDDSALFHERWRTLALQTLTPAALQADAKRAEFRTLVERTWNGRADPASVGYRLVRTFRAMLVRDVFAVLTAPAKHADPDFDFTRALRSEGPLWQLVTERPRHLLDARYASWDEQLLDAIDEAIADLTAGDGRLADRSWGEFNRAIVAHPLGSALPFAARWLNMPADPLPGDIYTPRAHSPRAGPSERLVVSPGREREGLLHMPTGQSGHPLSPHYGDQHHAWLSGDAVPLLPGPTVSRLMLRP